MNHVTGALTDLYCLNDFPDQEGVKVTLVLDTQIRPVVLSMTSTSKCLRNVAVRQRLCYVLKYSFTIRFPHG